mgnify:CR=1 FL=1
MGKDKIAKKNQKLINLIKHLHGLVENDDIEKQRQSQEQMGMIFGTARDTQYREVDISGMAGEWVSMERAHLKKYVILHCHGGGYATGSSTYARNLTSKLADVANMDVLCFDYRLAPEYPYPAALEDGVKAWNYLLSQGYDAENIVITGDSAGGNLALALTLTLMEEKRCLPAGLVLLSPWTDMTASGESYQTKAALDPILDMEYMDIIVSAYAGDCDLQNPLISPVFGKFEGFPPTYIQVGENEILLSDSMELARVMEEAQVLVKLDVFEGMWHVFQMTPLKTAKDAMNRVAEFVYEVLGV